MARVFSCAAGALALAAALPATAQENVQLYGRLNVALEALRSSGSGDSVQRLSNNRSVLGVRGSEDLGGGWQALFQVEGTLSPDTGAGSIADARVARHGGRTAGQRCASVTDVGRPALRQWRPVRQPGA